jgi:cyclopropane fatty-acyl-phospholipid synthase-like methyltransferase
LIADSLNRNAGDYVSSNARNPARARNGWLALGKGGFHLRRRQSLQLHYARTLDLCAEALEKNQDEAIEVQSEEVYERYAKYLTGCAKAFRIGYIDIDQFTLTQ